MKSLFRFMRGELNGAYLGFVLEAVERATAGMRTFLTQFSRMNISDYTTVPTDVIHGLGMFSGVMLPYVVSLSNRQAVFMTNSYIVNGKERSERGLFRRATETFRFVRTEYDTYPDDINTEATSEERSSVVGSDAPLGYIPNSAQDVILENGHVNPDVVLPSPPQNEGYVNFYGDKYLMIGASDRVQVTPSDALYLALIRAMQRVRYNGPTLASLMEIIDIICPEGAVLVTSIARTGSFLYTIRYVVTDSPTEDILQKIYLIQHVVGIKFPQCILVDENAS